MFLLNEDGLLHMSDYSNSPFCHPDIRILIEGARRHMGSLLMQLWHGWQACAAAGRGPVVSNSHTEVCCSGPPRLCCTLLTMHRAYILSCALSGR